MNASLPPGEWQTYDIVFRRPPLSQGRTAGLAPARMTVIHNGILVQDNVELWGPYRAGCSMRPTPTTPTGCLLPCRTTATRSGSAISGSGNCRSMPSPVRSESPPRPPSLWRRQCCSATPAANRTPDGNEYVISLHGDHLRAFFYRQPEIELVPPLGTGVRPALDGRPPAVRIWMRKAVPPDSSSRSGATGVRSSGLTDLLVPHSSTTPRDGRTRHSSAVPNRNRSSSAPFEGGCSWTGRVARFIQGMPPAALAAAPAREVSGLGFRRGGKEGTCVPSPRGPESGALAGERLHHDPAGAGAEGAAHPGPPGGKNPSGPRAGPHVRAGLRLSDCRPLKTTPGPTGIAPPAWKNRGRAWPAAHACLAGLGRHGKPTHGFYLAALLLAVPLYTGDPPGAEPLPPDPEGAQDHLRPGSPGQGARFSSASPTGARPATRPRPTSSSASPRAWTPTAGSPAPTTRR